MSFVDILSFWFQVSSFRFQVSGFRFQVSGFMSYFLPLTSYIILLTSYLLPHTSKLINGKPDLLHFFFLYAHNVVGDIAIQSRLVCHHQLIRHFLLGVSI